MSVVTSIIIIFPRSEYVSERIKEVNEFEFKGKKYDFHWIDNDTDPDNGSNCYSGTKVFNSVILMASYNNFPIDSFLNHMSSMVKWEYEAAVQVLINSEDTNDMSFKIYSYAGRVLVSDSLKF